MGHAFGLSHGIANRMEGSSLLVPAWPYALGRTAGWVPSTSRISISRARRPTSTSRRAWDASVEQRCLPSSVTTPCLSALMRFHVTTSKRLDGRGSRALRPSANRTASSSSLAWRGFPPSSRHLSGSPESKFSGLHTPGPGTNSLRRIMPTFASTAPFSCPAYGEHRELSNP